MKERKLARILTLLIVTVVLVAAVLGYKIVWSSNPKLGNLQEEQIKVSNQTRSLEVVNAHFYPKGISLTLKNNSDKTVTGFAVSIGKNHKIQHESIYSENENDRGIAPGETYVMNFPFKKVEGLEISINAALLSDKTGDGDRTEIQQFLVDERQGEKIQLERAIRVLKTFVTVPATEARTSFTEKCLPQLSAALDSPVKIALSEQAQTGLKNGKETILAQIQERQATFNYNDMDFHKSISDLMTFYEQVIAKL